MRSHHFLGAIGLLASSGAIAADTLPLRHGIYVPVARACKGASNAEIANYWGGHSSIGSSQGVCTIAKVRRIGSTYTLFEKCGDIQSRDEIQSEPTVVTIKSPGSFSLSGVTYRYCGPKVQF